MSIVYATEITVTPLKPLDDVIYVEKLLAPKPLDDVIYIEKPLALKPLDDVIYVEKPAMIKPLDDTVYIEKIVKIPKPLNDAVYVEAPPTAPPPAPTPPPTAPPPTAPQIPLWWIIPAGALALLGLFLGVKRKRKKKITKRGRGGEIIEIEEED